VTQQSSRRFIKQRGRRAAAALVVVFAGASALALVSTAGTADGLGVAGLTLEPSVSGGCKTFTVAEGADRANVPVSGRLVADAISQPLNGLDVAITLDGAPMGTARTRGDGTYTMTLPLTRAEHVVTAHLELPTSGTPLTPTGNALARNVGITDQSIRLCIDTNSLTITSDGPGVITASPTAFRSTVLRCRATVCRDLVDRHRAITLEAITDRGATFRGWTGACTGTARLCTIHDGGDVGARFIAPVSPGDPTLTVIVAGAGHVSDAGIDCPSVCTTSMPLDSVALLTATADQGAELGSWGTACPVAPTCAVRMDRDRTIKVNFNPIGTHRLTVIRGERVDHVGGEGGPIDCGRVCDAVVPAGTVVHLTAEPKRGSRTTWHGGCVVHETLCSVTLDVDRVVTVAAVGAVIPPREDCDTIGILCFTPKFPPGWPGSIPIGLLLFLTLGIAFPAGLFNSTLQNNYEEVVGWLSRSGAFRAVRAAYKRLPRPAALGLFVAFASVAATWADAKAASHFAPAFAGVVVVMVLAIVAFELPKLVQARMHGDQYGVSLRPFPAGLVIAAFCALGSRILKLNEPYVYGIIATFVVVRGKRDKEWEEHAVVLGAFLVTLLTLAAWVLWSLFADQARATHAGALSLFLGTVLGGAFLTGFGSILINYLPLKWLEGDVLRDWNPYAWGTIEAMALMLLVTVVSTPNPGNVGWHPAPFGSPAETIGSTLFVAAALGSFAFWGYFAWRDRATAVNTPHDGAGGGDRRLQDRVDRGLPARRPRRGAVSADDRRSDSPRHRRGGDRNRHPDRPAGERPSRVRRSGARRVGRSS